jgi:hypothetical protein
MTWAILDLETTGLSPWPAHEPWEATLILPGPDRWEITWQLPVDLGRADSKALQINHFHDRRWPTAATETERRSAITGMDSAAGDPGPGHIVHRDDMHFWAAEFARLVRGLALVGANVGFDMKDHLHGLLRRHGACPEYHYRPVCSEAALWGYLNGRLAADPDLVKEIDVAVLDLPWSHSALLEAAMAITAADLTISAEALHTSLGDCRLVEAVIDQITEWRP